jgi:hypothetical protein
LQDSVERLGLPLRLHAFPGSQFFSYPTKIIPNVNKSLDRSCGAILVSFLDLMIFLIR